MINEKNSYFKNKNKYLTSYQSFISNLFHDSIKIILFLILHSAVKSIMNT